MLGKLIKHELRATSHTMLPVIGAMLLTAVMGNVCVRLANGHDLPAAVSLIVLLIMVLFFVGIFAIGLVTVYMMVRRFRDNLLRDEGYIMHTLPVSVHAQIWSKVLVSALWYALAAVTIVAAVVLLTFDAETVKVIGDLFKTLYDVFTQGEGHIAEIVVEFLAVLVLASVAMSLSFDAALSVGHAFARHKMAASVAVYIGFLILGQIALSFAARLTVMTNFYGYLDAPYVDVYEFITYWRGICGAEAGLLVLEGAFCYGVTALFLKRRLNLE